MGSFPPFAFGTLIGTLIGSVRQCAVVCGSVRQCAAVCGSVRQCVAVCGSVWQCVAVHAYATRLSPSCLPGSWCAGLCPCARAMGLGRGAGFADGKCGPWPCPARALETRRRPAHAHAATSTFCCCLLRVIWPAAARSAPTHATDSAVGLCGRCRSVLRVRTARCARVCVGGKEWVVGRVRKGR
jgi:hypothetical protein